MQKLFILSISILFLFIGSIHAELDPELQQAIENNPDGLIPVIVVFKERIQAKGIIRNLRLSEEKLETLRARLREVMARRTERVQRLARLICNRLENQGRAENVRFFWANNSISGNLDARGIRELDASNLVESIAYDPPKKLIEGEPVLNFSGTSEASNGTFGRKQIRADLVTERGAGAVVAILDTGIDPNHPQFGADQIILSRDFTNSATGTADINSHGTHVAGTSCAENGIFRGQQYSIASESKIIAFKVLGDNGSGSNAGINAAIQSCISDGAHVANLSLGGAMNTRQFNSTVRFGTNVVIETAIAAGVTICIAAGNDGRNGDETIGFPGNDANVITVGACSFTGTLTDFSSTGPVVFADGVVRNKPDIVASGARIVSGVPGGGFAFFNGTSMATPHVAGASAVMVGVALDLGLNLTNVDGQGTPIHQIIKDIFKQTAGDALDKAGNPSTNPNLVGSGILNLKAAVDELKARFGARDPIIDASFFTNNVFNAQVAAAYNQIVGANASKAVFARIANLNPGNIANLFREVFEQAEAADIFATGNVNITSNEAGAPSGEVAVAGNFRFVIRFAQDGTPFWDFDDAGRASLANAVQDLLDSFQQPLLDQNFFSNARLLSDVRASYNQLMGPEASKVIFSRIAAQNPANVAVLFREIFDPSEANGIAATFELRVTLNLSGFPQNTEFRLNATFTAVIEFQGDNARWNFDANGKNFITNALRPFSASRPPAQ